MISVSTEDRHHFCGGFAHLNPGADLLKSRCERLDLNFLFCEPGFKSLLLLGNRGFQFLHFAVFFEKFIEQHRVDLS